jgi:hypothetical protein
MTKAQAIAVRQARVERIRLIRHRIVAGAVALFVATWLLITLILVTGHDPALARKAALTSTASTAASSPTTSSSSSASTGSASSSTGGSTSSSTGNSGVGSLTSSQS